MPSPSAPVETSADPRPQGLSLVRRVYWPRMLGVLLCAICLLSALSERPVPLLVWPLTVFFVLVWPHLAYRLALRAKTPCVPSASTCGSTRSS